MSGRETLKTTDHGAAPPDDNQPHEPALRSCEPAESSAEGGALRLLLQEEPFEDDAREAHFQRTFAEVARRLNPTVFGAKARDAQRTASEG